MKKGCQRAIGADGLYSVEREILEHLDAGKSADWIAEKLGKKPKFVRSIISLYTVNTPRENNIERKIVEATIALQRRIALVHPDRVSS